MVWILVAVNALPNVLCCSVLCVRLSYVIHFTALSVQGPNSMFKMTHIFQSL
jgi:hypothetical protein